MKAFNKSLLAASLLALASVANAGAIIAPVSGTINTNGPGSGSLTETINQAGLSAGYVSGVTDFDTYIASNPNHTTVFGGFEWFANLGTNDASVTYDLGSAILVNALALWNEESAGIGLLDLHYSLDNVTFTALSLGLTPTDNTLAGPYLADVFGFAATSLRYLRMDMSRCPQPVPGNYQSCAIGEVALRSAEESSAPEPATLALMGLGLAGIAAAKRRQA